MADIDSLPCLRCCASCRAKSWGTKLALIHAPKSTPFNSRSAYFFVVQEGKRNNDSTQDSMKVSEDNTNLAILRLQYHFHYFLFMPLCSELISKTKFAHQEVQIAPFCL